MENQGIMGLAPQQGTAVPPPTPAPQQAPASSEVDPRLFEAAKNSVTPEEFAKGSMEALRMQDPESAAAVDEIMSAQLPSDIVEGLLQLIDMILQNPQNYPAIRQESIAAGAPEEMFPPEFDAEYFMMLQLALRASPRGPASSEMSGGPQMGMMAPQMGMPEMGQAPQQFAMGGEVNGDPQMKMVAQYLQNQGRMGDTILAHINPQEAAMLKRMGGSGKINPVTGLPEFGWFEDKIVKPVKKFAKSTVGKAVIGVGLAFLTGGTSLVASAAAATGLSTTAIAGAIGGMGASALAGDKGLDIVKNGIMGAMGGTAVDAYNTAGGFTGNFLPQLGQNVKATGSTLLKAPGAVGDYLLGTTPAAGAGGATAAGAAKTAAAKTGIGSLLPSTSTLVGGTALAYGLGAFDKENPNPEDLGLGFKRDTTPTQEALKLLYEDPRYRIKLGNVSTAPSPVGPVSQAAPFSREDYVLARPQDYGVRTLAQGGIAATKQPIYGYVGGGSPQYPRRTGEIAGRGTGTSDDIPAMLSDGEFVFTAKAVRNMGSGDRKEGAKRMYAAMKQLEKGGMA